MTPYTIFQKHVPVGKCDYATLLHVKGRKKCHKKFDDWFTNKIFYMPENNFGYGFFHYKNVSKGSTCNYFPRKTKLLITC